MSSISLTLFRRLMSVTFQLGPRGSPVRRDAEADARAYLDAHRLHEAKKRKIKKELKR